MTPRRKISDMQRERIFLARGGVCHLCERKIRVGENWDVSHDRPLALLGEDGGDNLKVAHQTCHKVHTATEDMPRIAKAKRQARKHLGIRKPPAFRSKWKKKISGEVVLR
jgi:5-methylcytosine-specific restriction protein A